MLAIEDPCRTNEFINADACVLRHGTFRRKRSVQDRDAAGCVQRRLRGTQDVAIGIWWGDVCQVLGNGLSRHSEAVTVNQSGVEQRPHHNRDTTNPVDVAHHVLAEGLHIGEQRNTIRDALEVSELEVDVSLVRKCQQV